MDLTAESRASAVAAFREAVVIARTKVAFGKVCGCSSANIQQLLKKGSLLPAGYVLKVEAAFGVPRYKLRPDLYPPEPPAPPQEMPPAADRDGAPAHVASASNPAGTEGTCNRGAVLQHRRAGKSVASRLWGEALA
jgi:hypothetical protein